MTNASKLVEAIVANTKAARRAVTMGEITFFLKANAQTGDLSEDQIFNSARMAVALLVEIGDFYQYKNGTFAVRQ